MDFVREHSEDTGVFCFQEAFSSLYHVPDKKYRTNLFKEFGNALSSHKGRFAPAQDGFGYDGLVNFPLSFGLAQFVRKPIIAGSRGDIFVYGERNSRGNSLSTMPRNLQYATFGFNGEILTIAHFDGLYTGKGKGDTQERIQQSRNVRRVLDELPGRKILCGDLNLNPDTESLGILEEGMINLVKLFGITDTRGELYNKAERFADYMLISPELEERIKTFAVPNVAVSDHLPLILELTD